MWQNLVLNYNLIITLLCGNNIVLVFIILLLFLLLNFKSIFCAECFSCKFLLGFDLPSLLLDLFIDVGEGV